MRNKISLFLAGLSRQPSKEGKTTMLIGDMDITRLMIHVQQVDENKLKDKEVRILPSNRNRRDMFHHLLVPLHPETMVIIMFGVHNLLELDASSLQIV